MSCCAEDVGYAADSVQFAISTGCGDAAGVMLGHMAYKSVQKVVTDHPVSIVGELGTSTWLGAGALLAGTSWQPSVNFFHDVLGCSFTGAAVGTFAVCGTMFLGALRVGRMVMPWMAAGDKTNMKQDVGLSISIGGATGCFVATDMSFLGTPGSDALYSVFNPTLGVLESDTALQGCVKAGASTFTGFGLVNAFQNIVLPGGANWMDNNNPYSK